MLPLETSALLIAEAMLMLSKLEHIYKYHPIPAHKQEKQQGVSKRSEIFDWIEIQETKNLLLFDARDQESPTPHNLQASFAKVV